MLETPLDCNEIEELRGCRSPVHQQLVSQHGSATRASSGVDCYEEDDESDGEHLDYKRKKKLCDEDSDEMFSEEESDFGDETVYDDEGYNRERPVAQRPAKRGLCYRCHRGNRFTEKEACLVCRAKYCISCIIKAMGSMPEGRKCLSCIGFPVDDSKRQILGKCSRVLKRLLKGDEVKQIMNNEVSCAANQLPPKCICVNGSPLCMEELMELRHCSNPPRNLKPGRYWYDRFSGFWGKEGHKPCQIITPRLNIREAKMKRNASHGNTYMLINGREITKAELWMLLSAGVRCKDYVSIWLEADGTYQGEGMVTTLGKIWDKRRTKVMCAILALPTPDSPNSRRQSNNGNERELVDRALCDMFLVGNARFGSTTIHNEASVGHGDPFAEEEHQVINSMIQNTLYGHPGRLVEGSEQVAEESLSRKRKGNSVDQGCPSARWIFERVVRWNVGDVRKVSIWHDQWTPNLVTFKPSMGQRELTDEILPPSDAETVLQMPLSIYPTQDISAWHFKNHGEFTVRSAYHLISQVRQNIEASSSAPDDADHLWRCIWQQEASLKVKNFIHKLCNKGLAVKHSLFRCGIQTDMMCPRCGDSAETTEHMLFDCRFASIVWKLSSLRIDIHARNTVRAGAWIRELLHKGDKQANGMCMFIAWNIWRDRKLWVFEQKCEDPYLVASRAVDQFWEHYNAKQSSVLAIEGG